MIANKIPPLPEHLPAARIQASRARRAERYIHPAIFDGYLDGTLLNTLKEQTQTYLAENVAGMTAEEAAVAAFLRLRLGELEKQQKEAAGSAGNGRNPRSRPQRADPIRSSELLHNRLN